MSSSFRDETTDAGKAMWRKVDAAADRAPSWVRENVNNAVAKRMSAQNSDNQTTSKINKG